MSAADPTGIAALPRELDDRERWVEPFDWYREMRETAPVRHDPDRRCWDVFRYEDVKRMLADDATFSADPSTAADTPDAPGALGSMLSADPPRHDELRDVVDDAFRPGAVADLEPRVRDLAGDLLDGAVGAGGGELDVVADLATPLPVTVIAELLGVPVEERGRFKAWSDRLVGAADGEAGCDVDQPEMTRYFLDLLRERRAEPRDDLLTTLAAAEGSRLSRQEAIGTCILLLVAGNVTTTNLIANAVRCFTEEWSWEAVPTGDDLAAVIEEVLRYRSPVQAMTRYAARDVTLAGERIEAGDRVVAWLGSANRDGRAFDDPDRFRPGRRPTGHLAFGHGTHYCLGAPLARLEARVALSALRSRIDRLDRVDTTLEPVRSAFIYGVESLPVRVGSAAR